MIRDAMDILDPRDGNTAEATYYPTRTNDPSAGGRKFTYEYVDPRSRMYRRLFGNIQVFDADTVAIRTRDRLDFIIGGTVVTADGVCYRIIERQLDFSTASKQALRWFKTPLGTNFLLRLQSVENPWGIA